MNEVVRHAGVEFGHQRGPTAHGADRKPAADDLPEHRDVRVQPEQALDPPRRDPQGDHLVEDQEDPALAGLVAKEPDEFIRGWNEAGPVGHAFAAALANQSAGHNNLLAVLTPNLLCKPATVLITKVTIEGMKQVGQMFGPAQHAVAKAVADSVAEGVVPESEADDLFICVGVFIHWEATDDKKIQEFNYRATKEALTVDGDGALLIVLLGPS